jgi:hypothetical protein
MPENPEDFLRQQLFEIHNQLSWIIEVISLAVLLFVMDRLHNEHASWVFWVISFVVIAAVQWHLAHKFLDRKYQN